MEEVTCFKPFSESLFADKMHFMQFDTIVKMANYISCGDTKWNAPKTTMQSGLLRIQNSKIFFTYSLSKSNSGLPCFLAAIAGQETALVVHTCVC